MAKNEDYVDDYEGELNLEEAGYLEDFEHTEDEFEQAYDSIFETDAQVNEDTRSYERDAVTGRRSKRPKMSVLNKQRVSKEELDELFLG